MNLHALSILASIVGFSNDEASHILDRRLDRHTSERSDHGSRKGLAVFRTGDGHRLVGGEDVNSSVAMAVVWARGATVCIEASSS